MPTFNLTPILFPKPKKDELYDMLKDLLDVKEREMAIEQGGEIFNPASYNLLIKQWEQIANDPTISENRRRDARKKIKDLEIKQIKTELDRKKEIDSGDLRQSIEQDLRELEFEFPENPIAYATGALNKYQDVLYGTDDKMGLYDLIDVLQNHYVDTTQLESFKMEAEEELNKYADILDAYERGDMSRLNEYAVLYTPHAGRTKAMRIIHKGSTDPSHSQPTNLKFSRGTAGNLLTVSDENDGLQIYLIRANAIAGDKYIFGNSEFEYEGMGGRWVVSKPELFDFKRIKHSPLHALPSGNFVKDSKGRLFYVNQDRTFSPIKNEKWKEELGFQEDKVYHLSPSEEINTLPGATINIPLPIMERYNREAETSKFDMWQAFKEEWGKTWLERIPAGIERFEKEIKTGLPSVRAFHREALRKAEERRKKEIKKEEPKWGLSELETPSLLEAGKKFIKKLTPQIPK